MTPSKVVYRFFDAALGAALYSACVVAGGRPLTWRKVFAVSGAVGITWVAYLVMRYREPTR